MNGLNTEWLRNCEVLGKYIQLYKNYDIEFTYLRQFFP